MDGQTDRHTSHILHHGSGMMDVVHNLSPSRSLIVEQPEPACLIVEQPEPACLIVEQPLAGIRPAVQKALATCWMYSLMQNECLYLHLISASADPHFESRGYTCGVGSHSFCEKDVRQLQKTYPRPPRICYVQKWIHYVQKWMCCIQKWTCSVQKWTCYVQKWTCYVQICNKRIDK